MYFWEHFEQRALTRQIHYICTINYCKSVNDPHYIMLEKTFKHIYLQSSDVSQLLMDWLNFDIMSKEITT